MPLPKVVIVGRPNVGKSSLFNWLAGRRIAIVDDVSGVTRDRVGALVPTGAETGSAYFELVDTGGIGMVDRDDLADLVEKQIQHALDEADLILFVVDCREGRMPLDEEVAARLRYVDKPVVLVINKADEAAMESREDEFYKLGRGKPVYVSTKQNRNKQGLLDLIAERLPDAPTTQPAEEVMKVAVVGRPNTGKSTFVNTLARVERMIVSERAGTTRDSVDVKFELDGLPFVAIDTAGVRRKAKIKDDLDFYSVHRAERSIRRADVVLLFLDPTVGVARIDKQLGDYIGKHYKPVIFVVNKWDLMTQNPDGPSSEMMAKYAHGVQHAFRTMPYAPLAFITAKTGKNVKALLNLSQSMFKQAQKRVSTGALNKILRAAVDAHPPTMRENRTPKIYYATQVGTAPPTVVLFVNSPSLFEATYQRYLLNVFRQKLPFRDIPIKLYLRARTQSDPNAAPSEGDLVADSGPRVGKFRDPHPADLEDILGEEQLDHEVNELLSELDE
ncbi:MAG: ribosome-associated GTPase EngA [Planctomycetota bacterium]|nr:ribosome-associated GTPase EngA [Planctomycetota bacterium]